MNGIANARTVRGELTGSSLNGIVAYGQYQQVCGRKIDSPLQHGGSEPSGRIGGGLLGAGQNPDRLVAGISQGEAERQSCPSGTNQNERAHRFVSVPSLVTGPPGRLLEVSTQYPVPSERHTTAGNWQLGNWQLVAGNW
jgi:hypothetical protein